MAPQIFQHLVEIAQVRDLTPDENHQLMELFEKHPELKDEWFQEKALSALLLRSTISSPSDDLADRIMDQITTQPDRVDTPVPSRSNIWHAFLLLLEKPYFVAAACLCVVLPLTIFVVKNQTKPEAYPSIALKFENLPELDKELPSPIWTTEALQDIPAILYSLEVEKMIDEELLLALQSVQP